MATVLPASARPSWLIVGADMLRLLLSDLVPDVDVRSVDVPALSRELARRPRLVIVSQPPISLASVAALTTERRRPRSALRTVLLTAPDDLAGRLAALADGFDDALPNSMDPRELAARIRRLMAARQSALQPPAIKVGEDVVLDLNACELRRAGESMRLRPKEFDLLSLLASHPRRAFTRPELLERVWGLAFHGDPRTIDVHLRWLRSKVEADPQHPVHLVTVRGRGYRFDPPR